MVIRISMNINIKIKIKIRIKTKQRYDLGEGITFLRARQSDSLLFTFLALFTYVTKQLILNAMQKSQLAPGSPTNRPT